MKSIWYLFSLLTILLILFSNPKATSFGNIGGQSQLFGQTKNTEKNIQLATATSSLFFIATTIILISGLVL